MVTLLLAAATLVVPDRPAAVSTRLGALPARMAVVSDGRRRSPPGHRLGGWPKAWLDHLPGRRAAPDPKPGMRINQRLAKEGYATRRGADDLIIRGVVFINGRKAALGDRVLESDRVEVKGAAANAKYAYAAFHKPAGMDTHDEGPVTKNVLASLPPEFRALIERSPKAGQTTI